MKSFNGIINNNSNTNNINNNILDECVLTSNEICLKFNEKKSHCIIIGPHQHTYVANVVLAETFKVGK